MDTFFLFDWGNTLMRDDSAQTGPMRYWPHVFAMPGAQSALYWAAQQGKVGVASGAGDSDAQDILAALDRVGLAPFIEHVFCSKSLGHAKSDPRFWQSIIQQLQLPPQHIIVIGDTYGTDVLAPQKAGLRAVWFNWRQAPPQSCMTITDLNELPGRMSSDLLKS